MFGRAPEQKPTSASRPNAPVPPASELAPQQLPGHGVSVLLLLLLLQGDILVAVAGEERRRRRRHRCSLVRPPVRLQKERWIFFFVLHW
jgi:hypothetical protein